MADVITNAPEVQGVLILVLLELSLLVSVSYAACWYGWIVLILVLLELSLWDVLIGVVEQKSFKS